MGKPVLMGWLDAIVNVHFGVPAYALIDVTATAISTTPPPVPVVKFSLPGSEKLVQRLEKVARTKVPAHDVTTKLFFVWVNGVPEPTLANYGTVLTSGGTITFPYAGQFSVVADINSGGFQAQLWTPGNHTSGTYTTLADASAAAAAFNTFVLGHVGPQSITYYDEFNAAQGPVLYTGSYVVELDVVTHIPESDTVVLTGKYLISVPEQSADAQIDIVSTGPSTFQTVVGQIYTAQRSIRSYTQLQGPSDQGTTSTLSRIFMTTTGTPHFGTITMSSGGGTGGGG